MLGLGNNVWSTQNYVLLSNSYSVDFDGTNEYIDTGHHFSDVFDGSFTLSAWVKPDDGQPSANEMIMGVKDNDDSGSRISLILKTNGKVGFTYEANTGTYTDCETTNAVWTNGESTWKHIVATISNVDGAMIIYVNGKSAGTATNAVYNFISTYDADENLYIGSRNNAGSQDLGWSGRIDEVSIWSGGGNPGVLTASQVSDLYNSGNPTEIKGHPGGFGVGGSGLVSWYRMGDGTFDAFPLIGDENDTTLGTEMWDADSASGTVVDQWTAYLDNEIEVEDNTVKITYDNSALGAYIFLKDANDLNADLVVGKSYRLSADVKVSGLSGPSVQWKIVGPNVFLSKGGLKAGADTVTETTFHPYSVDFVATHATTNYLVVMGMGASEVAYIDNISLKPINGRPGVMTNMVSGDIVEDTP